jgi:hypothetical protein
MTVKMSFPSVWFIERSLYYPSNKKIFDEGHKKLSGILAYFCAEFLELEKLYLKL